MVSVEMITVTIMLAALSMSCSEAGVLFRHPEAETNKGSPISTSIHYSYDVPTGRVTVSQIRRSEDEYDVSISPPSVKSEAENMNSTQSDNDNNTENSGYLRLVPFAPLPTDNHVVIPHFFPIPALMTTPQGQQFNFVTLPITLKGIRREVQMMEMVMKMADSSSTKRQLGVESEAAQESTLLEMKVTNPNGTNTTGQDTISERRIESTIPMVQEKQEGESDQSGVNSNIDGNQTASSPILQDRSSPIELIQTNQTEISPENPITEVSDAVAVTNITSSMPFETKKSNRETSSQNEEVQASMSEVGLTTTEPAQDTAREVQNSDAEPATSKQVTTSKPSDEDAVKTKRKVSASLLADEQVSQIEGRRDAEEKNTKEQAQSETEPPKPNLEAAKFFMCKDAIAVDEQVTTKLHQDDNKGINKDIEVRMERVTQGSEIRQGSSDVITHPETTTRISDTNDDVIETMSSEAVFSTKQLASSSLPSNESKLEEVMVSMSEANTPNLNEDVLKGNSDSATVSGTDDVDGTSMPIETARTNIDSNNTDANLIRKEETRTVGSIEPTTTSDYTEMSPANKDAELRESSVRKVDVDVMPTTLKDSTSTINITRLTEDVSEPIPTKLNQEEKSVESSSQVGMISERTQDAVNTNTEINGSSSLSGEEMQTTVKPTTEAIMNDLAKDGAGSNESVNRGSTNV